LYCHMGLCVVAAASGPWRLCRDFNSMPVAQPLPNFTLQQLVLQPTPRTGNSSSSASSSSQAATQGQRLLNTCSSEALCELLRHLKRAYWPFPWDTNIDCFDEGGRGSTGGFRCAVCSAFYCGLYAGRVQPSFCLLWQSDFPCGQWHCPSKGSLFRLALSIGLGLPNVAHCIEATAEVFLLQMNPAGCTDLLLVMLALQGRCQGSTWFR
jgi:hypothetical protein